MESWFLFVFACLIFGSLTGLGMSVDRLRKSLESESAELRKLLTQIAERLGKQG